MALWDEIVSGTADGGGFMPNRPSLAFVPTVPIPRPTMFFVSRYRWPQRRAWPECGP